MSKRQAGTQITKDREEEDWGRDGPPDPVEQASAEVLASRKIAQPKTRKRANMGTAGEETKASNPFTFATPSSTAKTNPFGGLMATTASDGPAGTTSTTPVFSFGASTAKVADTVQQSAETSSFTSVAKPASSSNDSEFDRLLRQRSLNVSFHEAIKSCLAKDAFADLTTICTEYQTHRKAANNVPIEPAKGTDGTGIYPSFQNDAKVNEKEPSPEPAPPEAADNSTDIAKPASAAFSLSATAPAFSFKAPESSAPATFKFGESQPAETSAETPKFSFGQSSKISDTQTDVPTPQKKIVEAKSNDFSWTPDRGIKFGDSAGNSSQPPTFGFNNPLASPNQTTPTAGAETKPVASTKGFTFGSASNTGFSFGANTSTSSEGDASTTTKAGFSFGNTTTNDATAKSTPTFSFAGSNTTPTFSFGKKEEQVEAREETNPTFSFEKKKEQGEATEQTNTDEDAMPEEPRTNDALIAGPGAGEEDEDEVHLVPRAKLFKYNSENPASPWTDLGICIIRILVHKETKKARIIARAEGAGALRLNARMYPHFKYTFEPKSNLKVYNLTTENKTETFLIKTKDPATAKELTQVLNDRKA